MKISIPAWRNNQYESLEKLLCLIKNEVHKLWWLVKVLEVAPEPGASALQNVSPDLPLEFSDLLRLVTPNIQIIDGEAVAVSDLELKKPILSIRAIDSTSWDVETEMDEIISLIKQAYPEGYEIKEQ